MTNVKKYLFALTLNNGKDIIAKFKTYRSAKRQQTYYLEELNYICDIIRL